MNKFEVRFNENELRLQIRNEITRLFKQEIACFSDRRISELIRDVVAIRTNEIVGKIVDRASRLLTDEAIQALIEKENQRHDTMQV